MTTVAMQYQGANPGRAALDLDYLQQSLADRGIAVLREQPVGGGQKSPSTDLLVTIGTGLAGISTMLSAISLWLSNKPRYQVTVKQGQAEFSVSNLSHEQLAELGAQLSSVSRQAASPPIEVRIADENA